MQREILRIAGHVVDIIPNTINRNLQINNLGSAEDRSSNFSNTVKLPLTSTNQQVFEFLGVAGNTSRAPYKQLPCSYTVDGIPLIVNGYAEIKATSQHYEVVLYDGVIDLAEKIKGKTLSDLNYSDLNHYLSVENYTQSFSNTSGYVYAVGDFMGKPGVQVERQVPSIYTHTLWDKVFTQAGINYQGSFFTQNNDFLTEVVTPPIGYEVQVVQPTITLVGFYDTDTAAHNEVSKDMIFDATKLFGFNTTFASSLITFGTDGKLIVNSTTRLNLNADISYNNSAGYNVFQVLLNGGVIKSLHLVNEGTQAVLDLNLSVEEGDELQFRMRGSDTGYDDSNTVEGQEQTIDNQYSVSYSASANVTFSEVTGGYLVDFSQMMGSMSQLDFIKDVLYRYGLILKPIRGTRDYEFISFEELLNDRAGAEDWTFKLLGVDKEEYGVGYAKENIAKYSYHEDIKVPTHDGILSIENENADAEKIFFSSPYEIPIFNRMYKGQPLYYHPTWEEKQEEGLTVVKTKETKIKTFRVKYIENTTLTASFFNDTNGVSFTGNVPMLSLEKMSLQYFLNVYYKAYQLTINTYKEVDISLYLSDWDIYNLNFFKLKYFRQTGKYYYCNKIQHKAGGKISSGVFIELNGFSQNAPVEVLGTYTYNMNYDTTRTVSLSYLTTNSDPTYSDPESDPPYKVKFITGNGSQVKLFQGGIEIIPGEEILVSEWDVTVVDMVTTTAAHQATWEYQIMDEGSGIYGDAVGTFTASVYEFSNTAPTANAGSDQSITIDTSDTTAVEYAGTLDGSGSFDSTGNITSYVWEIISRPAGSDAYISDADTASPGAQFMVPNHTGNPGTYEVRLTVTDSHGLTGTDKMIMTVYNSANQVVAQ